MTRPTPWADAVILVMSVATLLVLAFSAGALVERERHNCPRPVTAEDFRP